ncbi:MAG: DMT family transporter [Pseudomonadota bacterium]
MELWIPLTIAAAAFQTLRFMAQKHLKATTLSTGGATLVRFLYAAPLVALLVLAFAGAGDVGLPSPGRGFWPYAMIGGAAQILATMCVVAIFAHRNFAVGISFKKTEVMLTALVGFLVLGDSVSWAGAGAIALGFLGVLWLSDPPEAAGPILTRVLNRAVALGLLSGVFFAISAVGYRGAVLAMDGPSTAMNAGATLAVVTAAQTLALGAWLLWREPGQVTAVCRAWRVGLPTGLLSMGGSFCWFSAFALQNAAYVFALGQIELIFSVLASVLVFGERIVRREYAGMAILTVSIVVLVMVA